MRYRSVRSIEDWARSRAAKRAPINSGGHRSDAHRFYQRRGYAATGLRLNKTL